MKASVYIATSLDGFIARDDGGLDWLPGADPDENGNAEREDYGYREFMDSVDVLVMGRKTYEKVLSFGKWSYEGKRVIVLSSGTVEIPTGLASTVECRSNSPSDLVDDLAEAGVKHIYLDGGNTIQRFLNEGLVQQIIITRIPVLIGSGIPLFGPLEDDILLRHVETRQFASGFVQSRYEVRR
jgi:dihydrofolate reductase